MRSEEEQIYGDGRSFWTQEASYIPDQMVRRRPKNIKISGKTTLRRPKIIEINGRGLCPGVDVNRLNKNIKL